MACITRYDQPVLASAMQIPQSRCDAPPSPHPLDQVDRRIIETLLSVETPLEIDIVQAARLITRYRDSLLSPDLYLKLQQVLTRWSMTTAELFERSRGIWMSGWLPSLAAPQQEDVGSGADVEG